MNISIIKNKRLVVRFLLAYLVVIGIASSFFYPVYMETLSVVRENTINNTYNTLKDGFNLLDNEIVKMQDMANALRNEQHVTDLIHLDDSQISTGDYYTMSAAQKYMQIITPPSNFINYYIYNNNGILIAQDRIYPNRRDMYGSYFEVQGQNFDQWMNSMENIGNFFKPKTNIMINNSPANGSNSSTMNGIVQYCILLPEYSFRQSSDSELVFLLDNDKMLGLLCTSEILSKGFVSVTDKTGQVILSRNLKQNLPNFAKSGIYNEKIERTDTAMMTINQSQSGLSVTVGIPQTVFKKRIEKIMDLMLLYFIISIVAGFFVAFYFAYKNSKSLSRLLETVGAIFSNAGKKNEYEYLNEAFLNLSETGRNYRKEIENLDESIRTSLFNSLLTSGISSANEIADSEKHLPFLNQQYIIAVLQLYNIVDTAGSHKLLNADLVKILIRNIIKEHMPNNIYIHNIIKERVVVVLKCENDRISDDCDDFRAFSMLAGEIFKSSSVKVKIGISMCRSGYQTVHNCYMQTSDAVRMADESSDVFIYSEDVEENHKALFNINDVQRLYELLLAGNETNAVAIIDGIYQNMTVWKSIPNDLVQRIYYNLQNVLFYASNELTAEHGFQIQFEDYHMEKSIVELFCQFRENAHKICEMVQNRRKSRNVKLKESIIEYLKTHYADSNICAAFVGNLFGITDKYLFSFVKEQTGKSFGDYLEGIRLEHANQWYEPRGKPRTPYEHPKGRGIPHPVAIKTE